MESRGTSRQALPFIVTLVLVLGAIGYKAIPWLRGKSAASAEREKVVRALTPRLAEWARLDVTISSSHDFARPKLVVIDKDTGRLHEGIFFLLPEHQRATNLDDVKTVVWVAKGESRMVATYSNGATGHVLSYNVTVIDLETRTAATFTRQGSQPPVVTGVKGEVYGDPPDRAVATTLAAIPAPTR